MKRFGMLLGVLGLLVLAACATTPNPITPQQVFVLENSYGVVQSAAITYAKLAPCDALRKILCSKREVVEKLVDLDNKARVALEKLEAFVRENPTLNASSLFDAAKLAIEAFKSYASQQQIKGV